MLWVWNKLKLLLLKWIWSIETYPSDLINWDPEGLEAENQEKVKFDFELLRERFDVLIEPIYIAQSYYEFSAPVYMSTDDFIEFHSQDVIVFTWQAKRGKTIHVFNGKFLKQKTVAVKFVHKKDEIESDNDLAIAERVKCCGSFVSYLFKLDQSDGRFIAMESYDFSLGNIPENIKVNAKDALSQILQGLEFLHNLKIAHLSISRFNIAVTIEPTVQFKITNFDCAMETDDQKHFAMDICALGNMIYGLYCKRCYKVTEEDWNGIKCREVHFDFESMDQNDVNLFNHLMRDMSRKKYVLRPSAKEAKIYPYLWSPRETLNFIVEISKIIESSEVRDKKFIKELKQKESSKIIFKDWRKRIDDELIVELATIKIKKSNLPVFMIPENKFEIFKNDICTLIQTIRNLIVHHQSNKIKKIIGNTEPEFLSYWTEHFPQLISYIFKKRKDFIANESKVH